MLISNNSPVRENYFDSNIYIEWFFKDIVMFSNELFEAGVARSSMFTSDVIKERNMHAEH